jgi:hypothetical protein
MAETEQSAGARPEADESAGQKIDLQALAERIYRLLKEEARLERERLGRFQAR